MICHISFLRTIPGPVFNSEVTIHFMNAIINMKQKSFNEIPHKNIESIKTLIDIVDFKTIIRCIRALIFDKTLIVFGDEISLLFKIVDGLKQLMFPFTAD